MNVCKICVSKLILSRQDQKLKRLVKRKGGGVFPLTPPPSSANQDPYAPLLGGCISQRHSSRILYLGSTLLAKGAASKKKNTFSITKIIHTKISLSQHHNKKLDDLKSMKGDKIVQKNGQGLKNLSLPNTACFRLL